MPLADDFFDPEVLVDGVARVPTLVVWAPPANRGAPLAWFAIPGRGAISAEIVPFTYFFGFLILFFFSSTFLPFSEGGRCCPWFRAS